jgi:prepilin-type N-terminal cleavage/methylation domain-containing protein
MKTSPMKKIRNPKSEIRNSAAFTLIELLVVIAIIGILAAFILGVGPAMKRRAYINKTGAEMAQLATAINSYKAAYNFYPPSGASSMVNPLYYELMGTTNNGATFQTLDYGSVPLTAIQVNAAFGVGGFVNCSKPGVGEDAPAAKSFITGLKPQQIGYVTNGSGITVYLLLGSAGGPDATYQPLGAPGMNPWRYVYPGVNNPGSYDLWIQLVIAGQTNLVCNWSKEVQINSPLP